MTGHSLILKLLLPILCWAWMSVSCFAQLDTANRVYSLNHAWARKDSSNIILFFASRVGCKSYKVDSITFEDPRKIDVLLLKGTARRGSKAKPAPLLRLHGNIAYSFDYRSQLDTPFATNNLQQHHEEVYADATLKGKYPFRIVLDSRQTNSPFFKNYNDVNIEFKPQAFRQGVKEAMIAEMTEKTRASDSANKYQQLLNAQKSKLLALTSWLADPARKQDIVQEKEQLYHQVILLSEQQAKNELPKDSSNSASHASNPLAMPVSSFTVPVLKDSLNAQLKRRKDSLLALMHQPGPVEQNMTARQKSADSLYKAMMGTQAQADSSRAKEDSAVRAMTASIRNAHSIGELEEIGKKTGTTALSGSDKALLGVTHFNIGRSSVNYSDLTVNNISLTGVNIEYNPSWYAAFAAGSVDYLFRDFVVAPGSLPKQNLVLGRFGWGNKAKQFYVLTVYTGTKNSFGGNAIVVPASGQAVTTTSVFGYSFEAIYRLDPNKVFSFEAAKSSTPYAPGTGRGQSMDDAFAYSTRENEAFSAKFDLNIPATKSTFNVFYKEVGANFQSYSVFNTGNRQTGWGFKWRQSLFKNQLTVNVQVKKNTFDDPLIASSSSTMLFESLQLVYRRKKWPVFSLGYMPSTQLTKDSAGNLVENVYYALTATAVYSYSVKKLRMTSSLMYSQFYNKGTDSGFVLYDARNILYSHQIFLGKFNTQTDIQYTQQPELDYWMFQQGMNIGIGKYVSIGGSVKNDMVAGSTAAYWGGGLQGQINFRKVGSLRMQYSKDYISNGTNTLVPYNWGRVNWVKVF